MELGGVLRIGWVGLDGFLDVSGVDELHWMDGTDRILENGLDALDGLSWRDWTGRVGLDGLYRYHLLDWIAFIGLVRSDWIDWMHLRNITTRIASDLS